METCGGGRCFIGFGSETQRPGLLGLCGLLCRGGEPCTALPGLGINVVHLLRRFRLFDVRTGEHDAPLQMNFTCELVNGAGLPGPLFLNIHADKA